MEWKHPKLKLLHTGNTVDIYTLPFTIGRSLTNRLVVENPSVSRVHGVIVKQDKDFVFQDKSTNGTLINRQLYRKDNARVLRHGDIITLYPEGCVYEFLTHDDAAASPVVGQKDEASPSFVNDEASPSRVNDENAASATGDEDGVANDRNEVMQTSRVDELRAGERATSSPGNVSENGISDELLCVLADNILHNAGIQKQEDSEPGPSTSADAALFEPLSNTIEVVQTTGSASSQTRTADDSNLLNSNPDLAENNSNFDRSDNANPNGNSSHFTSVAQSSSDVPGSSSNIPGIGSTVPGVNSNVSAISSDVALSSSSVEATSGDTKKVKVDESMHGASASDVMSDFRNYLRNISDTHMEGHTAPSLSQPLPHSALERLKPPSHPWDNMRGVAVPPNPIWPPFHAPRREGMSNAPIAPPVPHLPVNYSSVLPPVQPYPAPSIRSLYPVYGGTDPQGPNRGLGQTPVTLLNVSNGSVRVLNLSNRANVQGCPFVAGSSNVQGSPNGTSNFNVQYYPNAQSSSNVPRQPMAPSNANPSLANVSNVHGSLNVPSNANVWGYSNASSSSNVQGRSNGVNTPNNHYLPNVPSSPNALLTMHNPNVSHHQNAASNENVNVTSRLKICVHPNMGRSLNVQYYPNPGSNLNVNASSSINILGCASVANGSNVRGAPVVASSSNVQNSTNPASSSNFQHRPSNAQSGINIVGCVSLANASNIRGGPVVASSLNVQSSANAPSSSNVQARPNVASSSSVQGFADPGSRVGVECWLRSLVSGSSIQDFANATSGSNVQPRPNLASSSNVQGGSNVASSANVQSSSVVSTSTGKMDKEGEVESSQDTIIMTGELKVKNDGKQETEEKDKKVAQEKKEETIQYEEMENELQCAICAELFIKATTLNCSHTFCRHCIDTWRKNKMDCPICRQQITSASHTLVLDNVVNMMVEGSSAEAKERRREVVAERDEKERERERAAAAAAPGNPDRFMRGSIRMVLTYPVSTAANVNVPAPGTALRSARRVAANLHQPSTSGQQQRETRSGRRATDARQHSARTGGRRRSSRSGQRPATGQQPTTAAQQPTTADQQPTTADQQSTTGGQQPAAAGQQPATMDQQPAVADQQPPTTEQRPESRQSSSSSSSTSTDEQNSVVEEWSTGGTSEMDQSEDNDWYGEYEGGDWGGNYSAGRPGAYYGGYGRCFICGDRGHWANGCVWR